MNAYQNSYLSMFKSVHGTVTSEEHAPLTEDFTGAQEGVAKLAVKIGLLEDAVLVQTDPPAAAQQKKQDRANLVSSAILVSGALLSCSHKTSDKRLEKKASIPASTLERAKDSKLVAICRGLHKTAAPLTQALKGCNITAAQLSGFKQATDDYKKNYTKPREAIATGKAATSQVPVIIRATRSLLSKELDPLMMQFKKTEPEFYAKYQAARRLVKPAAPPEKKQKKKPATKPQGNTTPASGSAPGATKVA